MQKIILPPGMISDHAASCAAYAVGETDHICERNVDIYHAKREGWRLRRIMRTMWHGGVEPDPSEVGWVCPACLEHYDAEDEK